MMVLIAYDVSVLTASGRKRLRTISKTCLNYGNRVQNSVFECEVTPENWVRLKSQLLRIYCDTEDSLRFYHLGSNWKPRVEHFGVKESTDTLRESIVL